MKSLRAFSLIEVVIALGIFAFSIVGIFSLLPVAMNSSQSVYNESSANNIAASIAGLWEVAPTTGITITNTNFPLSDFFIGQSNLSTNYFDQFGRQTNLSGAALAMLYSATTNSDPYTNSFTVSMEFYWPAGSPNTNTRTSRTFNYIFTK